MGKFTSPEIAWTALVFCLLLLPATVAAQDSTNGKTLYLNYCTGCHGSTGKGDGPAGESLPVKPADHTNRSVMNRMTDRYLFEIISEGGTSVGKSPFMPAWDHALTERQINNLVAFIRSLAEPQSDPEQKPED